jgi:hypothetical protein
MAITNGTVEIIQDTLALASAKIEWGLETYPEDETGAHTAFLVTVLEFAQVLADHGPENFDMLKFIDKAAALS